MDYVNEFCEQFHKKELYSRILAGMFRGEYENSLKLCSQLIKECKEGDQNV